MNKKTVVKLLDLFLFLFVLFLAIIFGLTVGVILLEILDDIGFDDKILHISAVGTSAFLTLSLFSNMINKGEIKKHDVHN